MNGTGRLFGTDGIRAPFGTFPLDRPTVTALAFHLAATLRAAASGRPLVVLGGDSRDSTPEIGQWLADGLVAGGAAPRWAGTLPTPGVAWLVRALGADAGVAVSASHNPHPDNGVKLVDRDGRKWSVEDETTLERRVGARPARVPHLAAGALVPDPGLAAAYLAGLAATLPGARPLAGLRLVLDAANGAASPHAGALFERLGASAVVHNDRPDGRNINAASGSTHPQPMAAATAAAGADLGAAFDGDADRAILADERGTVRDGDAILYLWARALRERGELEPAAIVATSMSNLGLERALAAHGIRVVRCDVGDRTVVETMEREGILLGGEQSGHVVHRGLSTTGDGMLTAAHLAAIVARSGEPLSRLLADFSRYPQLLRNVRVARKPPLLELPRVAAAARHVEESLHGDGRLVLRYSGTEPLARIMIEGPDQAAIDALAEELAASIAAEIGA